MKLKSVFPLIVLGLLMALCCNAAKTPDAHEGTSNVLSFVCPLGERAPAGALHLGGDCGYASSPGEQAYCGLCVAVCYDVSWPGEPVQCWFNCMEAYGYYYLIVKQGPAHTQPVEDRSKPFAWDLPPALAPSVMSLLRN